MGIPQIIRSVATYAFGAFWGLLVVIQVIRLTLTKRGKFYYKKDRKTPPDCLLQACFGDHRYVNLKRQGLRIHYMESGAADKPVIILLHGFPEFWYSWRYQIKHFNKHYRVLAVDLPGYGGSSKPSAVDNYSIEQLTEDIRDFIETLDLEPSVVVGHDWGGCITWTLASRYPALVKKAVVLNCPHPLVIFKFAQTSWRQLMKSWYMFFVNLPYFPEWFFSTGDLKMLNNAFQGRGMGAKSGAFTDVDMEAFKYTFNKPSDFTGPMNYIRSAIRGLGPSLECPLIRDVPMMLLWGTRDGALSKEMAPLCAEHASDFRLEYIDGASHWVQQDEPQKVNILIQDFLNQK